MSLMEIDPRFLAEYEQAEYRQQYKQGINQALRRIDRVREELIAAQNELCVVLEGSNDYARSIFAEFYRSGGVTARDWEAHTAGRAQFLRAANLSRGQLRIIRGGHAK